MTAKENREQQLLLLLAKQQEYITADILASRIGTSQKTVYRLVKKINEQQGGAPLILSEKGRGYKLDYEKYMSRVQRIPTSTHACSPVERRNRILEELLLLSPKAKKVISLFAPYFVGESVIFNDEQLMAETISKYGLQLVRKQRTLAIKGPESAIRRAIVEVIQTLHTIDLDELSENTQTTFNSYDVRFVLDEIRKMEGELGSTIPYPYNINIFSHLYILLSRARTMASMKERYLVDELSSEQLKQLEGTTLYQVASTIIAHVSIYLHCQLPTIESYYLYQYLTASRMQGSYATGALFSPKVNAITQFYIQEMTQRLKIPAINDQIYNDLANHIKPMLNRLTHTINVRNGLLTQIKVTYGTIFKEVSAVSKSVSDTFDLPPINEDENGFIALYFARLVETSQPSIKTLIMCTTGIGTSELLRAKVEKQFPLLDVIAVEATRNVKKNIEKYPETQLILSTVHLNEQVPIQTLVVSAMLTADDQKRIQQKMEEVWNDGTTTYNHHL